MEAINDTSAKPKTGKLKKIGKSMGTNVIVAATATATMAATTTPFQILTMEGMQKINKGFSKENKKEIKDCFDKILETANLKGKVVLKDFSGKEAKNQTFLKRIKDNFLDVTKAVTNGTNARYGSSAVECNMKKLPAAIFHELGHAVNDKNSPFWSAMQKIGNPTLTITTLVMMFCSLTKKAKPKEEGKELTKGQKFKNFIRNNAGKIAFMTAIPTLAEEGVATIRGNSWAKKFLNPSLAKKVYAHNAVAYISYLAFAAGLALATFTARKVKDKIDEKNEAKLQ